MVRDIEKQRAARRRWYERNREQAQEKIKERKQEIKDWFVTLKSDLSCTACGENHPACLDFHHKDPNEKEIALAKVIKQGWSKEKILAEIAKCDVLCANCHRKLHYRLLV